MQGTVDTATCCRPRPVDCDGLERAEQTADRVVLHAAVGDARWREFCLRVADRVVLVASNPAVPVAPLPTRATGADLVLAGRPPAGSTDVPGSS